MIYYIFYFVLHGFNSGGDSADASTVFFVSFHAVYGNSPMLMVDTAVAIS